MTIRLATVKDSSLIAELGAITFQETFAADNTEEDMAAYLRETFTPEQLRQELGDHASTFLLAEVEGIPTGYAKLYRGDPETGVTGAKPIELSRLYVLARNIGQGVGAALMQACLSRATDLGFDAVWLGVWEHNHRALAFYRRWGFEPVGSHLFRLGSDTQTDLILQKRLELRR